MEIKQNYEQNKYSTISGQELSRTPNLAWWERASIDRCRSVMMLMMMPGEVSGQTDQQHIHKSLLEIWTNSQEDASSKKGNQNKSLKVCVPERWAMLEFCSFNKNCINMVVERNYNNDGWIIRDCHGWGDFSSRGPVDLPSSAVMSPSVDCLARCSIIIVTDDNDYRSKAGLTGT